MDDHHILETLTCIRKTPVAAPSMHGPNLDRQFSPCIRYVMRTERNGLRIFRIGYKSRRDRNRSSNTYSSIYKSNECSHLENDGNYMALGRICVHYCHVCKQVGQIDEMDIEEGGWSHIDISKFKPQSFPLEKCHLYDRHGYILSSLIADACSECSCLDGEAFTVGRLTFVRCVRCRSIQFISAPTVDGVDDDDDDDTDDFHNNSD